MSAEPEFRHLEIEPPIPSQRLSLPRVRLHLLLFVATVVSVLYTGAAMQSTAEGSFFSDLVNPRFLASGASFALPLIAILLTHELGHFVAARLHRVPASLPYFIPAPGIGPGTMGAVISMSGPIRSRNALLDIGASGPIAGMVVAVPVLAWGLAHSPILADPGTPLAREGQSLLYIAMKLAVVGPIPTGHDVLLHPTALAGWFGLMLTMINLLPWGQLDGGHIAYALVGDRHHAVARWLRRGLLLLFAYNVLRFVVPVLLGTSSLPLPFALMNSAFWLVWFIVLGVLSRVSGGAEHPPYEPGRLTPGRRALGWATLALFVLLFMPTPMAVY